MRLRETKADYGPFLSHLEVAGKCIDEIFESLMCPVDGRTFPGPNQRFILAKIPACKVINIQHKKRRSGSIQRWLLPNSRSTKRNF